MIFNITSSKNEKFKFFKSLKTKKARTEFFRYTVEGIKSVHDAVNANSAIDAILVSQTFYNEQNIEYINDIDIYVIGDEIFSSLSTTETPQGIIAVIKKNDNEFVINPEKDYIYCDHIQDPGNLGTIIRTADAAGFGGVILSPDCVEVYNPKTVRASMGSFFHVAISENIPVSTLLEYKSLGFSIVCGSLSENTVNYTDADFTKPVIIAVGNEANGISDELLCTSDINIKIPILGSAESLNAAVAAAIIMYEVNRQKSL